MPPKRRRENSPTNEGVGKEKKKKPRPRKHDTLWFNDGSIVLATDIHVYRVHISTLIQHSKVFSEDLEMPTGDTNIRLNDLPLFWMVGDTDDEVQLLLKALYHRK